MMSLPLAASGAEAMSVLSRFPIEFYDCLYTRADALRVHRGGTVCGRAGDIVGRADTDGRVSARARGDARRGQSRLVGTARPAATACLHAVASCGRRADRLAMDVSNWLRPNALTSPELLFSTDEAAAPLR